MRVSKAGAFAMALITVMWAVTPALACLVSANQMTAAERECCQKMAQQCGTAVMPSSHSCCQHPNQRNTAVSPVATYTPPRHFSVAVVPQTAAILVDLASFSRLSPALEPRPPEASPHCISVLRI
jgi:hypothetical protein